MFIVDFLVCRAACFLQIPEVTTGILGLGSLLGQFGSAEHFCFVSHQYLPWL